MIANRPGFATVSNDTGGAWTGIDVDLCLGLSVALFRDSSFVEYVEVGNATEGFQAVATDVADVFADLSLPYYDELGLNLLNLRPLSMMFFVEIPLIRKIELPTTYKSRLTSLTGRNFRWK